MNRLTNADTSNKTMRASRSWWECSERLLMALNINCRGKCQLCSHRALFENNPV